MAIKTEAQAFEEELTADLGGFTLDPLGCVMYLFPWGQPGDLEKVKAPRKWQCEYLDDLGKQLRAAATGAERSAIAAASIRRAIASGHGIGKSALVCMLIMWAMSTCEDTRCVITANTETQLKVKTWAELAKWHRLALNSHWFTFTATALYSADPAHEKTWRADMVPWNEKNPEAFAGLHNQGKRILLVFDEASAIPNNIWEVAEGAMTDEDTEIIWAVFGNPTRNTGTFKECFGSRRGKWNPVSIDSREVEGTNKAEIQAWVDEHGEDSDFVRIRVRGLFPRASSLQFIDMDTVAKAQTKEASYLAGDPLIMTLDVARGGDDECVFAFRRGLDARSIPWVFVPGSEVRDSMRLVGIAADLMEKHQPDAFMGDGTGVGGPVLDRIRQLGYSVFEVQFGSASPNPKQANMRAYMWQNAKEWLRAGGAIPKDPKLEDDLCGPEYTHNNRDQLVLEPKDAMKRRGLASPDRGDALAMSFAVKVAVKTEGTGRKAKMRGKLDADWDPMGLDTLAEES